jgi:CRISPR-associated Cas5-like protein
MNYYGDPFKLKVSGKFACFTRPEFVERRSALVPSHSGWNGVFNQILGHKGMEYRIDRVWVNFIPRHINVMVNEVKSFSSKVNTSNPNERTLRNSSILTDVDYTVECRIVSGTYEDLKKYETMFHEGRMRRNSKNPKSFWRQPYLGIKEYIANIDYDNGPSRAVKINQELGISFFGTDYKDNKNYFYPMAISDGLVEYPTWDEVKSRNIVLNF